MAVALASMVFTTLSGTISHFRKHEIIIICAGRLMSGVPLAALLTDEISAITDPGVSEDCGAVHAPITSVWAEVEAPGWRNRR